MEAGQHSDSIARILVESGCSFVVCIAFIITATHATYFARAFYQSLSRGNSYPVSILHARQALSEFRGRRCGQRYLKVEDWFLPVGYFHGTIEEMDEILQDETATDSTQTIEPHFLGRELDLLRLERTLLVDSNIVIVHGSAGIGKTSLLDFFGNWWQMTGLVKKYVLHDFTQSTDSFNEGILDLCTSFGSEIAPAEAHDFMAAMVSEGSESGKTIIDMLREECHLLLHDNVQSTQTWDKSTVMRKKKLLSRLEGGRTLILLSTRQVGREIPIISKHEPSIYRLLGLDNDSNGALIDSLSVDIPQGSDLEFDRTRYSKTFGELRGSPLLIKLVINARFEKDNVAFLDSSLHLDKDELMTALLESFGDQLSEQDHFLPSALAPFGTRLVRSSLVRYGTVLQKLQLFPDINPSRLLTLVDRLQRSDFD
ncbi:MAG: hypothetical protein GOMPHAMPRED_003952 [Gomphillus americanus]|uniref:Uncharacterized protein n=1 Tax=Gomphillus americanus TaxID=1940652 RepID=A0A8H3FGW9_9LECA|nr:MAG: hypothetical protein GOMPHAMPRED_003952 [Gomphillus americanus]